MSDETRYPKMPWAHPSVDADGHDLIRSALTLRELTDDLPLRPVAALRRELDDFGGMLDRDTPRAVRRILEDDLADPGDVAQEIQRDLETDEYGLVAMLCEVPQREVSRCLSGQQVSRLSHLYGTLAMSRAKEGFRPHVTHAEVTDTNAAPSDFSKPTAVRAFMEVSGHLDAVRAAERTPDNRFTARMEVKAVAMPSGEIDRMEVQVQPKATNRDPDVRAQAGGGIRANPCLMSHLSEGDHPGRDVLEAAIAKVARELAPEGHPVREVKDESAPAAPGM